MRGSSEGRSAIGGSGISLELNRSTGRPCGIDMLSFDEGGRAFTIVKLALSGVSALIARPLPLEFSVGI